MSYRRTLRTLALAVAVGIGASMITGAQIAQASQELVVNQAAPDGSSDGQRHMRPGKGLKEHPMGVQGLIQSIDEHPQAAVQRLTETLARIQQREKAMRDQITQDQTQATALKNALQRDLALAAVEVRKAELIRVEKMEVMVHKALAYARHKAGAAPSP